MKIRITLELPDDLWGFSDALDDGCTMKHMRDVALEDSQAFVEMAEFISVEKETTHDPR